MMIPIFVFLFGLAAGSFLNVVICRLRAKKSIFKGRSECPGCRHILGIFDLMPLFSFLLLGGKCRYCRRKISWQYPAVELAAGILFVMAYFKYFSLSGIPPTYGCSATLCRRLLLDWFFISVMVVVFVYDLKHYLILDRVVIPASILAFLSGLFFGVPLWGLLLGGLVAGGFFFLQFTASRGKWIGGGDIKLGILMGLVLGWPDILAALFLAYIMGSAVGLALIASGKKKWKSQLPFGTFLAAATVVAMLWGDRIISWYLSLMG